MADIKTGKILITGLPRTGTTSISVASLALGYRVAHVIQTKDAIRTAQVVADSPVFAFYEHIIQQFKHSIVVHLTRTPDLWIPSIQRLLSRMLMNLNRSDGGFHPSIKQSYRRVFGELNDKLVQNNEYLWHCYQRHQHLVESYCRQANIPLLLLDVSQVDSYQQYCDFLVHNAPIKPCKITIEVRQSFEPVNQGNKITFWKNLTHPNKISPLYRDNTPPKLNQLTFNSIY